MAKKPKVTRKSKSKFDALMPKPQIRIAEMAKKAGMADTPPEPKRGGKL